MRGNHRDYQHSRVPKQSSPRRQMINDELDQHTVRIKELLKADITVLQEENALLKTKCKKLNQLQDKVEIVLRQNNQLLGENEKMSRLLHQHKSQNEMLRGKLESFGNQRIGQLSEFEFKQKKLLAEIQSLNAEIRQLQNIKNLQISDLKTQFQVDIANIKRQHASAIDVYEQEIRKFKEIIDKKEYQLEDLSNRLKRVVSESEYDGLKEKQEREKLRNQMNYMEADHQKDLADLKSRLNANYLEELDQVKRNHNLAYQDLESQNDRLVDKIDRLELQNAKLKEDLHKGSNYYQDHISSLKRQIDDLKLQLIELEKISESEKAQLENRLSSLHDQQIQQIRILNNDQLGKLEDQIIALQNNNGSKSAQIQQLLREKSTTRNLFDNQVARLKEDIYLQRQKFADLEKGLNERISALQKKLTEEEKQNDNLNQLNNDLKERHQSELNSLKSIIAQKKNDLEKEVRQHQEDTQLAKEKEARLTNERHELKEALRKEEKEKKVHVSNLKNQLQSVDKDLRTKLETLLVKINLIERENEGLKKNIQLKDKQIQSLRQRLQQSEDRERKQEDQLADNREKILKKDKKVNQLLEQQKKRLQKSHSYAVENLKSDHEAAMRLESAKINELRDSLGKKGKQLENLLKMYKKMTEQVKILTQQEANKKNINLKFAGATAELIATKNMFDVFLKTKVLDVCGDALDMKQNILEEQSD